MFKNLTTPIVGSGCILVLITSILTLFHIFQPNSDVPSVDSLEILQYVSNSNENSNQHDEKSTSNSETIESSSSSVYTVDELSDTSPQDTSEDVAKSLTKHSSKKHQNYSSTYQPKRYLIFGDCYKEKDWRVQYGTNLRYYKQWLDRIEELQSDSNWIVKKIIINHFSKSPWDDWFNNHRYNHSNFSFIENPEQDIVQWIINVGCLSHHMWYDSAQKYFSQKHDALKQINSSIMTKIRPPLSQSSLTSTHRADGTVITGENGISVAQTITSAETTSAYNNTVEILSWLSKHIFIAEDDILSQVYYIKNN